jgi:predicted ester cyclase
VNSYRTAFPDVTLIIDDILAEGNKVTVRWTARGTHKGELMRIPPTGKEVTLTGISVVRIAGGKVAEHWVTWDMA